MLKWRFNKIQKIVLCSLVIPCVFGGNAFAQARKAVPGGASAKAAAAKTAGQADREIQVRKVELNQVKTPDYSSNAGESSITVKDWAKIIVRFDTDPDWIDQLEMRFYIVVKNPKTFAYTMFTGVFTYVEVSKGRNHQAAVFLRPRTIERYGIPERAGVEVYSKGELVSAGSCPEDSKLWWRAAGANMRTVEGYVLERSQTPFALIAIDNYETPKGK